MLFDVWWGDVWKMFCFGFYLSVVFIYVLLKLLIWDVMLMKGKIVINFVNMINCFVWVVVCRNVKGKKKLSWNFGNKLSGN